jgi:hypothetical protein
LVLIIAFTTTTLADTAGVLISGDHAYKAVRLTPSVDNRAKANMADILVLNEEGTPLPYFIRSYDSEVTTSTAEFVLQFADAFRKDGNTYHDYFFTMGGNGDLQYDFQATALNIGSGAAMFAKDITLWGGYDGLVWEYVQSDKLYKVDDSEKLYINFGKSLKYTYYRFELRNNTDISLITDVTAIYNRHTEDSVFFTETFNPVFKTETEGKNTFIQLEGLKHVKINDVTLRTDDLFKRTARFGGYNYKTLYNLAFGEDVYQDLTIAFNSYYTNDELLVITIENGDDAPIQIDGVTLTYFTDEIIFKGENEKSCTLSFGNASITAPPVYDIANYQDLIIKEGYDLLTLGPIQTESADIPLERDFTMVFNIVVAAVAVLLGVVIFMALRRGTK